MAQTYETRDGDVVDAICWRHYGVVTAAILHAVLEANTGLGDAGPILQAGIVIELPEISLPADIEQDVSLWTA